MAENDFKSKNVLISDELQHFINSLAEDVLLKHEVFDDTKRSRLKKFSSAGIEPRVLERNLSDFFELYNNYQPTKSDAQKRILKLQSQQCYIGDVTFNKLIENKNKKRIEETPEVVVQNQKSKSLTQKVVWGIVGVACILALILIILNINKKPVEQKGDDMVAAGKYTEAAEMYKLGSDTSANCLFKYFELFLIRKIESQLDGKQYALLQTLAQKGNRDAMAILGEMYGNGVGVSHDKEKSINWYRKAGMDHDAEITFFPPEDSIGYSVKEINDWKEKNKAVIMSKTTDKDIGEYSIPKVMMDENRELVYLLLNSKSISDKKEQQNWFDLYPLMNEEKILKLYSILMREGYKLFDIERIYQGKQKAIKLQYQTIGQAQIPLFILNRADSLSDAKNYTTAIALLEKNLKVFESDTLYNVSFAYIRLGNLYYLNATNYEKAKDYYLKYYNFVKPLLQNAPDKYVSWFSNNLSSLANVYGKLGDYKSAIKSAEENINLVDKYKVFFENYRSNISGKYGSLAWFYLFTKDYIAAEQISQKALEIDSKQTWLKTNLAHALLFQGKTSDAEKIYVELANTIYHDNETYAKTLLDDFDQFEKAGVVPQNNKNLLDRIKEYLNNRKTK